MLRKITLRKKGPTWQILNYKGDVISERRFHYEAQAVNWCKIFLSSFDETFILEVESDGRHDSSKKT